jgi:hypothetical protein
VFQTAKAEYDKAHDKNNLNSFDVVFTIPQIEFRCEVCEIKFEIRDKMRNGLSRQSLLIFTDIISLLEKSVTVPPFAAFVATSIRCDTSFATFNGYEW